MVMLRYSQAFKPDGKALITQVAGTGKWTPFVGTQLIRKTGIQVDAKHLDIHGQQQTKKQRASRTQPARLNIVINLFSKHWLFQKLKAVLSSSLTWSN